MGDRQASCRRIIRSLLLVMAVTVITASGLGNAVLEEELVMEKDYIAGLALDDSQWGANKYVQYVPGNLPLVISVPHGGSLAPGSIPDRQSGVRVNDAKTVELGFKIREHMKTTFGHAPHLVVNHLHRSKVDMNRAVKEATDVNSDAVKSYEEYHKFIETARKAVSDGHKNGLYIDLHGTAHVEEWTEFGYLLFKEDLQKDDAEMDASRKYARRSSIRHLAKLVSEQAQTPFSTILRGSDSLGTLLEKEGYVAVPSATNPSPGDKHYFRGGYSVRQHSSRDGDLIDGVQVETPRPIRMHEAKRIKFAEAFARAVDSFVKRHFLVSLKSSSTT